MKEGREKKEECFMRTATAVNTPIRKLELDIDNTKIVSL